MHDPPFSIYIFKVNCNQNSTEQRESDYLQGASMLQVYSSTVLSKPHSSNRDENWINLMIWQAAVWLQNLHRVCLAETVNQFIHGLSFLNLLFFRLINNLSPYRVNCFYSKFIFHDISGPFSVDSLVLWTKHLRIWDIVRMTERLLFFYFFS